MICVSIQGKKYEEILAILSNQDVEMAEIRLDLCPELSDQEIEDIFANCDTPLIATGRKDYRRLEIAVRAGARFCDLELEAPVGVSKSMQKLCKEVGTELIRSYHNFELTPSGEMLLQIKDRCFRYGADIAKIVTTASSDEDWAILKSLYKSVPRGRLVAFLMGNGGRESRLECLGLGSPYTYVALNEDERTAPGQLILYEAAEEIYKGRKPYLGKAKKMPASKSFAQRAILAAALSEGVSRLRSYSPCNDSEAAIKVAEALGAKVSREGGSLVIEGRGNSKTSLESLSVGESGLLARLMIPVMSALNDGKITIEGEKTLLTRPLNGASNIMAAFGVILSDNHIPLTVKGNMIPGTADVSGKDGSQLISGLLMSLPLCAKPSTLYVSEPKSIPYMYITQDVLGKFGVKISCEMEGNAEMLQQNDWSYCTGMTFKIPGGQTFKAASFDLEGDWSSAAAYMVAGAVFGSVELLGLDPQSVQADISMMDILVDAGAVVSVVEDEVGDVVGVRKAPLEAVTEDLNHCPDLFPMTAVLAAFCNGVSRLAGVGRLLSKESNRADSILEMLHGLGVEAYVEEDEMVISGEGLSSRIAGGRLLKGGKFSSFHDHRLVMALRVAELGADGPIEIDDEACISKSYPGFML